MKKKQFSYEISDKLYIKPIKNPSILSHSEEKSLFLDFLNNDPFAREILINSNLKLVMSIARSHLFSPHSIEDLIQEGTLGLIHAISKFDYTLEKKFSTYATNWIKNYILKYRNQRMIRLPQNITNTLNKASFFSYTYFQNEGKLPTTETIALFLNITPKKLLSILSYIENSSITQNDNSFSEDFFSSFTSNNPYFSPEQTLEKKENKDLLNFFLKTLTPREIFIFQERYGLSGDKEKSFMQIAVQLKLTKEAVRQIELKAMKKLQILAKNFSLRP